jgi:pimeloyl-ACP methyl ester carboxylesterase
MLSGAAASTSGGTPPTPSAEHFAHFDLARLRRIQTTELVEQFFLDSEDLDLFAAPRFEVDLFRVVYPSTIPEQNRQTLATGLIAVPCMPSNASKNGADDVEPPASSTTDAETIFSRRRTLDVVVYNHGTTFSRSEAPSCIENSMETRLAVATFAGHGFCVVSGDYFGKGGSTEPDSYMMKESTERAILDMIEVSKTLLGEMGYDIGKFFLTGWSLGGWATLITLQALNRLQIPVTAVATACAPPDSYRSILQWIRNPLPTDANYIPAVLGLHFCAYETYFGRKGFVSRAVRSEYLEQTWAFYEGKMDWDTFLQKTTPSAPDYVNSDFLPAGIAEGCEDEDYWRTVKEKEAYRFVNTVPLRVYYGERDEVLPVWFARLIGDYQSEIGGTTTQSIEFKGANHRKTFLLAFSEQLSWFNEFRGRQ